MRSLISSLGALALALAALSGCYNSGNAHPDAGPPVDAGHAIDAGSPAASACVAQTRGCSGNTPRECVDGGWSDLTACAGEVPLCSFGLCVCADGTSACLDAGLAPSSGCQTGSRDCASATSPQVCVDGGWVVQAACGGHASLCSTGDCVCPDGSTACLDAGPAPVCFPATRGCADATTPEQCSDGGWQALAACTGDSPVCTAGACTCVEGATECVGVTPRTCTGGVWVNDSDCSGVTPICAAGACVCADGGMSCQGNTPLLCVGATFVPQTACVGETSVCSAGACVCSDGAASCSATGAPQVCTAGVEVAQTACSGPTPACDAGACVCAEGEGSCNGNVPTSCVNGTYVLGTACAGSTPLCSLGTCVTSTALAVSSVNVCTVADGGLMSCWGSNGEGELGIGGYASSTTPVFVAILGLGTDGGPDAGLLTHVVGVSTGGNDSFAVLSDGTVAAWGYDYYGELGQSVPSFGTTLPMLVPGVSGAVAVGSNYSVTCALRGDGIVLCWGYGESGSLGTTANNVIAAPPLPVQNLAGVVELSVGQGQSCARLQDGTVSCWGTNYNSQAGQPNGGIVTEATPVAGVEGAVSISCGDDFSCAIAGDAGAVSCWGYDVSGVFGTYTGGVSSVGPVPVGLTGAVRVAAGDHHVCALEGDQTVWCWGGNDVGQLGQGNTAPVSAPTQVPGLAGVTELAAGGSVTCARRSTGQLLCWGDDGVGELGNGVTGVRPAPVPVAGLSGVAQISAGGNFTCALLDGGQAACWGSDADGELGDGLTTDRALPTPVPGLSGVQQLSAGGYHACATLQNGTVTCWGSDAAGQTQADGGGTIPSALGLTNVAAVQASRSQLANIPTMSACQNECSDSCALLDGGGVLCWGDNIAGQLANGSFDTTEVPPGTAILPAPAVQLALGGMHGCALLDDGTVACWGDNTYGQLGDGTYASHAAGDRVLGLINVLQVVSGEQHSCALANSVDGGAFGVWCWGDDSYGQLGDDYCCGSTVPSPDLAQVYASSGDGAYPVALAAGLYHTCAVLSDGTVNCWGDNQYGECGSPYGGGYPETVTAIDTAVAITAGGALANINGNFAAHTCAILADSSAQCWGSDRYGEVGDGSFGYVATPMGVPLP